MDVWELDHKECWVPRIDAFKLCCWRRLLRAPWTARRSNQSILKEINTEYSLQRLMLKLKFQYSGHLMWRADSYVEKTLMLGKIEGRRRRGRQGWDGWMVSPTRWTWVRANSRRWWRTGKPGMLQSVWSQRVEHDLVTEHNNTNKCIFIFICFLLLPWKANTKNRWFYEIRPYTLLPWTQS